MVPTLHVALPDRHEYELHSGRRQGKQDVDLVNVDDLRVASFWLRCARGVEMTRLWFKSQSIVLALLFAVSVFLPGPRQASANTVVTDTGNCAWSGATWFTSIGWGGTSGDPDCALKTVLVLWYYESGTWNTVGYQINDYYWI
jgi:hypothetical protein